MRSPLWFSIGLTAFGLAACSSPPEAGVEAAKAALDAARPQAQEYAAAELKAAEDAYADLEAELNAQSKKFTLFRSYDAATAKATAAQQAADNAKAAAQAGEQAAMQAAASAVQGAQTALAQTMAMLESAPRGKGSAADLAALKTDLESAGAMLAESEAMMSAKRYKEVQAKADAAMNAINGVKTQVEAAMAKVAKKK
jgi:hypothetical protein